MSSTLVHGVGMDSGFQPLLNPRSLDLIGM